jgi:hypothetical protein
MTQLQRPRPILLLLLCTAAVMATLVGATKNNVGESIAEQQQVPPPTRRHVIPLFKPFSTDGGNGRVDSPQANFPIHSNLHEFQPGPYAQYYRGAAGAGNGPTRERGSGLVSVAVAALAVLGGFFVAGIVFGMCVHCACRATDHTYEHKKRVASEHIDRAHHHHSDKKSSGKPSSSDDE